MSDDVTIESIPLYTNLDRITKGLAALGIGSTDSIQPEQLFPFDQWHYHGTDAIRTAAEQLGIASESQVLDMDLSQTFPDQCASRGRVRDDITFGCGRGFWAAVFLPLVASMRV